MRIRRGQHERNFTVLPNDFLQDERMSWTTRGILAEILSRPPGWECTADSLAANATKARGERVGEGRRAVRASFAEGEKFGYIVRTRERIAAGEPDAGQFHTVLTFYDTPQDSGQGTGTGTSAPPAETHETPGRTDVPVMDGPSPVRLKKEQKKKEQKNRKNSAVAQARDQSRPPSIPAIAEVAADAEDPAGAGAFTRGKTEGEVGSEARRGDVRQRDDSWRAQLAAADLDDLHDALAEYHDARSGLEMWAYRTAASDLGFDFGADEEVPESPDGDWTRLAYLYLLKKHDPNPVLAKLGHDPANWWTETPDGEQLDGVIVLGDTANPDLWDGRVWLGWDQRAGWALCDDVSRALFPLDLDTYAAPEAVAARAANRLTGRPDGAAGEDWEGAETLAAAVREWEKG